MRLYLAAPLFTAAERKYNTYLCGLLEEVGYNVFLPQRDVPQYEANKPHSPARIFDADLAGLRNVNCVVAICDGADVDSGTAWECGYAYSRGIPVIALRTDFRAFGVDERFNLTIEQSARKVVGDIWHLMEALSSLTRMHKQERSTGSIAKK